MNTNQLRERIDCYEKLMRLDKPIGILLLLWPTLWGLWLSSQGRPNWVVVWIFAVSYTHLLSAYLLWRLLVDFLKPVPYEFPGGLSGIQIVCILALLIYLPLVVSNWRGIRLFPLKAES